MVRSSTVRVARSGCATCAAGWRTSTRWFRTATGGPADGRRAGVARAGDQSGVSRATAGPAGSDRRLGRGWQRSGGRCRLAGSPSTTTTFSATGSSAPGPSWSTRHWPPRSARPSSPSPNSARCTRRSGVPRSTRETSTAKSHAEVSAPRWRVSAERGVHPGSSATGGRSSTARNRAVLASTKTSASSRSSPAPSSSFLSESSSSGLVSAAM